MYVSQVNINQYLSVFFFQICPALFTLLILSPHVYSLSIPLQKKPSTPIYSHFPLKASVTYSLPSRVLPLRVSFDLT